MSSRYIQSLSQADCEKLKQNLLSIQSGTCFICEEKIDFDIHSHSINIDHIIPLSTGGKDAEGNFALTHESCNKSKLDANLNLARKLCVLKKIQGSIEKGKKSASLKHVLEKYDGSKYTFSYKLSDNEKEIEYSLSQTGDNTVYKVPIFKDNISNEQTCFVEVPIEYIYFDETINPRGINNSISKLAKEFYKRNPQLHLSLARIEDGKLKIFDGQHKAVVRILLGERKLLMRVFINPDIERLTETNTNAGSTLRQIAFDKSIMRQLNHTLYVAKLVKYRHDRELEEGDLSFSEQQLVDHFKGEGKRIKKYIVDNIKDTITHATNNKLKNYINFEGRSKELPISYSAFDKTILSDLIDANCILTTPINFGLEEGNNPREIEIDQITRLMNILAEEIYIDKFIPEIGIDRIEQKIIDKKDKGISDDHIVAYRISKEEIMKNWIVYVRKVIESYFHTTGEMFETSKIFQIKWAEQLWENIRIFIQNLIALPLWKDKSMASTIFSGKKTYGYWKEIFETGKSPDGTLVLAKKLNYMEMIQHDYRSSS